MNQYTSRLTLTRDTVIQFNDAQENASSLLINIELINLSHIPNIIDDDDDDDKKPSTGKNTWLNITNLLIVYFP